MYPIRNDQCNISTEFSSSCNVQEKPIKIFSLSDFKVEYSMYINSGEIKIVNLSQKSEFILNIPEDRYYHNGETHIDSEKFYFVLESHLFTTAAQYVYCFNPKNSFKPIEYMFGPLKDPNFIRNRLVEFGVGCNQNETGLPFNGKAVITIYDLNEAKGARQVQKHILTDGCAIWDCWVDEENEKIIAGDQSNKHYEFNIF